MFELSASEYDDDGYSYRDDEGRVAAAWDAETFYALREQEQEREQAAFEDAANAQARSRSERVAEAFWARLIALMGWGGRR